LHFCYNFTALQCFDGGLLVILWKNISKVQLLYLKLFLISLNGSVSQNPSIDLISENSEKGIAMLGLILDLKSLK